MLTLVGRELCLFLHVDASRVPARQRDAFLALAIRRAARSVTVKDCVSM